MEYTTQDIIEYIVQDFGVEYDEAMRKLYTSEVFEKLQNPEKPRFAAFSFVHRGMTNDRGAKKGKTADFQQFYEKEREIRNFFEILLFSVLNFSWNLCRIVLYDSQIKTKTCDFQEMREIKCPTDCFRA